MVLLVCLGWLVLLLGILCVWHSIIIAVFIITRFIVFIWRISKFTLYLLLLFLFLVFLCDNYVIRGLIWIKSGLWFLVSLLLLCYLWLICLIIIIAVVIFFFIRIFKECYRLLRRFPLHHWFVELILMIKSSSGLVILLLWCTIEPVFLIVIMSIFFIFIHLFLISSFFCFSFSPNCFFLFLSFPFEHLLFFLFSSSLKFFLLSLFLFQQHLFSAFA